MLVDDWLSILLYIHCNTLQHTATHCNTLQHTAKSKVSRLDALMWLAVHLTTHCNTLYHTATSKVGGRLAHRRLVFNLATLRSTVGSSCWRNAPSPFSHSSWWRELCRRALAPWGPRASRNGGAGVFIYYFWVHSAGTTGTPKWGEQAKFLSVWSHFSQKKFSIV